MNISSERGVSLLITFLIVSVMLSIVLGLSVILFSEIKIVGNVGSSVTAYYAGESGVEKTLYFDQKQIPSGATHGLCNICTSCTSSDCTSCTATALASGGCNTTTCNNCEVKYTSTFGSATYNVDATIVPQSQGSSVLVLTIDAKGFYKDSARVVEVSSAQ